MAESSPGLARLNRLAAIVTLFFALLALLAFAVGHFGGDLHGGLMGLVVSVFLLPFVLAFWLAARAWDRGWRFRVIVQLFPVAVLIASCLVV